VSGLAGRHDEASDRGHRLPTGVNPQWHGVMAVYPLTGAGAAQAFVPSRTRHLLPV